jgi:hypothetical protein
MLQGRSLTLERHFASDGMQFLYLMSQHLSPNNHPLHSNTVAKDD